MHLNGSVPFCTPQKLFQTLSLLPSGLPVLRLDKLMHRIQCAKSICLKNVLHDGD